MSTALVATPTAVAETDQASLVSKLRTMRMGLPNASVGDVAQAFLESEAILAAAKRMRAEEVAREATETRSRCERRIGEILLAGGEFPNLETIRGYSRFAELAKMPGKIYEKSLSGMLDRNLACTPNAVIKRGQMSSLVRIESGIFRSYDEKLFIQPDRKRKPILWGSAERDASDPSYDPIANAKEQLLEYQGAKARGTTTSARGVDELHAKARALADAISKLRSLKAQVDVDQDIAGISTQEPFAWYGREVQALLGRAEYLIGDAANVLHEAWLLHRNEASARRR